MSRFAQAIKAPADHEDRGSNEQFDSVHAVVYRITGAGALSALTDSARDAR